MGTGSMGHNNRKFITENVDPARTEQNITLRRENLKQVYHELFDEALAEYNAKKTKTRDKIPDYYHRASEGADQFAGAAAPAIHSEAAEGGAGAVRSEGREHGAGVRAEPPEGSHGEADAASRGCADLSGGEAAGTVSAICAEGKSAYYAGTQAGTQARQRHEYGRNEPVKAGLANASPARYNGFEKCAINLLII